MATQRKTSAKSKQSAAPLPAIPIDPVTGLPVGYEIVEDDIDDVTALTNVMSELGASEEAGGYVQVYKEKVSPGGTKRENEYLGKFIASDFSLDEIKGRWGAGKYTFNVYREGKAGFETRKTITIAADPQLSGLPMTVQPAPDPAAALSPLLAVMQQGFERMLAGLTQLAAQKQPSLLDNLEQLRVLRDVFAPVQSPAQNYNPVEMMKLGVEMAGMAGGENNNMWVSKMIETFGAPMMEMMMASKASPQPHAAALPQPARAPSVSPAASIKTEEGDPMKAFIYQYLRFLDKAAEKNAPVPEYADSVLAMVPASDVPEFKQMLSDPLWREKLREHTDVVEKHPDWFTGLRNTILAFIADDERLTEEEKQATLGHHADDTAGDTEHDQGSPGAAT